MAVEIVVVPGGIVSRKNYILYVVDGSGNPINVTGSTFKLQGTSADIGTTIDALGTLTDAVNGVVTWAGLGSLITPTNMGAHPSVLYTFRVKWADSGAKVDYSSSFNWTFLSAPF